MSPDPQPADDLRKLEARMEDQWQVFGEQVDRRIETHDDRFVATDRRIDIVHDRLAGKIDELAEEVERRGRALLYVTGTTAAVVAVALAIAAVLLA